MRKKSWLVNALSFVLALIITVSSLVSSNSIPEGTIKVEADTSAKSRVQTFIGLAAGKSGTALPDIGQLTQDELQFLGVYLSNFYVPFATELGNNVSSQEILTKQKENMVNALNLNLNFNEVVAGELVDSILGLARSNCRELEFRVSVDYHPSNQSSYEILSGFDTNYYTFLNCMSGGMFDTTDLAVSEKETIMFFVESEKHSLAKNAGFYLGLKWLNIVRSGGFEAHREEMTEERATYLAAEEFIRDGSYCWFKEEDWEWRESTLRPGSSRGTKHIVGMKQVSIPGVGIDYSGCDDNCSSYNDLYPYVYAWLNSVREASDSDGCIVLFDARREEILKTGSVPEVADCYFPYNYGYFGYVDTNGDFIPVFDCGFNCKSTACMDAFALCWNNLNWEEGYGFNFFDFTDEEVNGKNYADAMSVLNYMSDSNSFLATQYASKMYIDCFGDILVLGNNHQYVCIPGCLNPYTWVSVDDYGEDVYSAGAVRYVINAFDISNYNFLYNFRYAGGMPTNIWGTHNLVSENLIDYYNTCFDNYRFVDFGDDCVSLADAFLEEAADSLLGGYGVDHYYTFGVPWRFVRGSNRYFLNAADDSWCTSYAEGSTLMSKIEKGAGSVKPWMYLYNVGGFTNASSKWSNRDNKILSAVPHVLPKCLDSESPEGEWVDYLNIEVASEMCMIDNLGAFGFDSSNSDIAYTAIQFVDYLDTYGNPKIDYSDWTSAIASNFSSLASKTESGSINSYSMTDLCAVSLYTTYAVAGLYKDDAKGDSIGKLHIRMNREDLPKISNSPLTFSESYADEIMKRDIQNMIYYALKPDGVEYIKVMIKNKLQAILVDWHNDMVGTNGVGYTTGTTYYRTNYGYVTTPDLSELQWTASLLDLYDSFIPLLVIFMIVCMLISFITGVMSLQRAVLGALVFSAFLLVPTNAINFVVEKSNSFTNNIYGEKFIYWAVVQEETFGNAIDSAASGDNYENYIRTLYSVNEANQGGESIVVKWQAPKKMASLMLSSKDKSLLNSLKGGLLTGKLMGSAVSGEAYLDGASQYLYRDYSDLANFSRYIYHSVGEAKTRKTAGTHVLLYNSINGVSVDDSYKSYVNSGYTNGSNDVCKGTILNSIYSKVYDDAVKDEVLYKVRNGVVGQDEYLGINQDLFNVSIAYFNNTEEATEYGSQPLNFKLAIDNNKSSGNSEDLENWFSRYPVGYTSDSGVYNAFIGEGPWNSLMVYGLVSESPFYYYSWNMYDDKMSTLSNSSGGYRSMLLSDGEGNYFYNMKGNGELKDFMNMRNLFYFVIPYLKKGNDIVRAWDERYGIFVYDGVPTDEGYLSDHTIQSDATLKYKYWHNLNVARLYEIYTPWVDLMYDCRYANPCYVKVMGEKYWIEDPLDPWSYPDERPMIFSESEMLDYGLSEADLTEVERRILKFNRESQKDMFELLNYYNFSDLSLNTAAAMQCTFNFNRVFSETGLFSSNINLYPQAFEIKDFSYDAFLRFILSTTTGESLSSSTDFYGDLVKKSSTTTALLLLICDILSQYVVPFAKIVFLMAIFLSSILLIMVSVFRVDPEFKFVVKLCKDIFIPLAEFFAVTIAFAYVISLFMGTGNNAVTQTANVSISLGDPNMVLVAMCVLNVVCIVLYVKLLLNIWECIKTSASLIKSHVTGLTGGVVAMGVAGAKGVAGAFKGNSSGVGSYNESGTGTESARATARSIKHKDDVAEKADMGKTESDRMAETRRRTISNEDGKSDEKRSGVINSIINSGKNKRNSDKGNETGKEKEGKSDSPEKKDDK